jgi:hypothetical protein
VWSSLARLGEGTLEEMEDGFHLSPLALAKATQMILNLVKCCHWMLPACNMNFSFRCAMTI